MANFDALWRRFWQVMAYIDVFQDLKILRIFLTKIDVCDNFNSRNFNGYWCHLKFIFVSWVNGRKCSSVNVKVCQKYLEWFKKYSFSILYLKIKNYSLIYHYWCSAWKQVLGIQFPQHSISMARRLIFSYVSSALISSSIMICGFPLPLFPSIRPSITS